MHGDNKNSLMEQTIKNLPPDCFHGAMIGLEREGLRVRHDGLISQATHPHILGSPLTHPFITTDFSEALLELVTPPCKNSHDALSFLSDTDTFVRQQLNGEYVWSASMPCFLRGEADIPIAHYGNSDLGKMKMIYRRGLAHRYGKVMQVIAGIHFNYSFSESILARLQFAEKQDISVTEYISDKYMAVIRNIQRYGWLNIYLFGASPAICHSFTENRPSYLDTFDKTSYLHPHATSLRMSDIGYTNNCSNRKFDVSYDSLEAYLRTLGYLINMPHAAYDDINERNKNEAQQLNSNILQIESEYYATVRPKQVPKDGESYFKALQHRGIRYVELRSLDINPFYPSGLEHNQMHFLEVFMHYCLLKNSPIINQHERRCIDKNQNDVALQGRNPKLHIDRFDGKIKMKTWALQIVDEMQTIADTMDISHDTTRYNRALTEQRRKVLDPQLTPSARILHEMYENRESFTEFSLRKSAEHHDHFQAIQLATGHHKYYEYVCRKSHREQQKLETCDNPREMINRLILNEVTA